MDLMNDLYAYNDWANQRVLSLCDGLSDQQLDTPREMGFGSLRATLFHILHAEVIWLERWKLQPWREFQTDPQGMSVDEIASGLAEVAAQRRDFVQQHRSDQWQQPISFQDSKKTPHEFRLRDLLLHVANHGVHHRAQALNYLKQFDRTVVAGIDYIFYRLAQHAVEQTPEARESLGVYGLQVSDPDDSPCPWSLSLAQRIFQYNDWAQQQTLAFAADLSEDALDRDFQMGPGSIRKILLHLFDAERWWVWNLTTGPQPFPSSAPNTPVAELKEQWTDVAKQRDHVIADVDETDAQRVVEVLAGGPPTRFRVGESIIHLAIHASHHRAQLINMFRHVDAPWKNIDLLYAIDQLP